MMINNSYTSENPFQLIHRVLLVYTRIRVSLSASGIGRYFPRFAIVS